MPCATAATVLTSSLYFGTQAHLSAAQLVLLGTGMAVTLTVSDIMAGVWSDAFSRKWPLVLGHGYLAAGMLLTGLRIVEARIRRRARGPGQLRPGLLPRHGRPAGAGRSARRAARLPGRTAGQQDRVQRHPGGQRGLGEPRSPGPVRATVHSFLSQAETLGEILGGGTMAALAQAAGIAATLLTAAALLAGTGVLVARARAR